MRVALYLSIFEAYIGFIAYFNQFEEELADDVR